MSEFHFPFAISTVLCPVAAAVAIGQVENSRRAQQWATAASAVTLLLAILTWHDFGVTHVREGDSATVHNHWALLAETLDSVLVVDQLTAPLLPMAAVLFFLTILTTQRTKLPRFSFPLCLASEAIVLATFSSRDPWIVTALLAAGTVPPYLELRARRKPARVYILHMSVFVVLMVIGVAGIRLGSAPAVTPVAVVMLLVAIFIRCGVVPFHCWMSDLFEHASFGTALLFVAPMSGIYAVIRLLIPISQDWVLQTVSVLALMSATYASGMALVQREARRFFCFLFLSYIALVLVGLDLNNSVALTGSLGIWISSAIALGGLALTLRSLEARFGRMSLDDFHGLYEHVPALAICFALTGLAGVGFPGTAGFLGAEMLVDGAIASFPVAGVTVLVVLALNGIAILQAYFVLFTGRQHVSSISLRAGAREKIAFAILAALLLVGGIAPQPTVVSLEEAAEGILNAASHADVNSRLESVPSMTRVESRPNAD